MILVGNKCDLHSKREIEISVGRDKAKEWGVPFLEASAKKDINVQVWFTREMITCRDVLILFRKYFLP